MTIAAPFLASGFVLSLFLGGVSESKLSHRLARMAIATVFTIAVYGYVRFQEGRKAQESEEIKAEVIAQRQWRDSEAVRIAREAQQRALAENPAGLLPGDEPTPPGACNGPEVLNIFLGKTALGAATFPFVALKVRGRPVISLDRNTRGELFVDMVLRDELGNVVAHIIRNRVLIPDTSQAYFEPRTDLQNVRILNRKGDQIFRAEYLNTQAMRITADLVEGGTRIRISEQRIEFGHVSIDGGAVCGSPTAIEF